MSWQTCIPSKNFFKRRWTLLLTCVICVGIEGVLQFVELFSYHLRLRATLYENAGFWVDLLHAWVPNYAAQPYLMFLTYGFLHAGIMHLLMNMITLWCLGSEVLERVGVRGYILLYFGTLIGAAATHAVLATSSAPVVGASGALFGLAGGLLSWAYIDRFMQQQALWPILRMTALLIVLNVVMWWAMDGRLAWQAHLGGFVSGWVLALLIDPRPETDAA